MTNNIDKHFKQVGEFGLYQLIICFLVGTTSFIPALLAYSYIFISATPEHRYIFYEEKIACVFF